MNACDHDARRRKGRFVCLKCRAVYAFLPEGARWIERQPRQALAT